ncbi:E3 SUMO-protein ligase SIZ1 isoform X2 [Diospyros lotus]|uniref:E3 SUMO-protein ligase SIZ1 isoform X2 n=1 Tax=Diospyros lotus TaxID=55363 RepID=UPI002259D7A2|nr:E3 SUMO-protein ligase SIZ1 isoform X2 [Diospyros lotus]
MYGNILVVLLFQRSLWKVFNQLFPRFFIVNSADSIGQTRIFLLTTEQPLCPVKLTPINSPTDGTNPMQSIERTFHLSRTQKDLLLKPEYDLQAWCMLLNDKVPFRMQWPQCPDLKVNGISVRTINRPGPQLLGANGRDDGSNITQTVGDGVYKISLTGCDSRIFCFGVRIVKRRTVQQVISLIPKESDGEQFEDALARVRRCVGGGTAMENADSDSDLEIVADSIPVNLRCPMSGSRMKVAGRFKPCVHMACFDLDVFVAMNQRSRKWQCPICLKNYSLENIIIDPYFNRITYKMRNCGEDVTEIEVKPDGSWRAKADGDRRDLGDLGLWHFPDGTLYAPTDDDVDPKSDAFKNIKQEGVSDGHSSLKLGIKKNCYGYWEFSKPEDIHGLSSSYKLEKHENNSQNVIPMSSSANGSGRDGEDPSVNQDGGGNFDFSNNGIELESIPLNIEQTYGFSSQIVAPLGEAEVIVLSDSEEENDAMISSGPVFKNVGIDTGGVTFPPPHGNLDSYPEDPALGSGASSCLGLFNANDDEYAASFWPLPPGTQAGSSFQLFASDADISDALVDLQNGPINCPPSTNGYTLMAEAPMDSAAHPPSSSVGRSNADLNDGLVDNPLPYGGDDPPLQLFLTSRPSDASIQPSLRDQSDVSNSIRSEDWISLRLGGGSTSHGGECTTANGLNSQQQLQSNERAMDSLADTGSLLLGMDDNTSGKTSRERSDSPFSFPRQRRSVRPRLYLSINSDSD